MCAKQHQKLVSHCEKVWLLNLLWLIIQLNDLINVESSKTQNVRRASEKNIINDNDKANYTETQSPLKKSKKSRHEKSKAQNSGIVIDKWTMLLIVIATFIIGSLFGLGLSNFKMWM